MQEVRVAGEQVAYLGVVEPCVVEVDVDWNDIEEGGDALLVGGGGGIEDFICLYSIC